LTALASARGCGARPRSRPVAARRAV
jgi:hypothetical protein